MSPSSQILPVGLRYQNTCTCYGCDGSSRYTLIICCSHTHRHTHTYTHENEPAPLQKKTWKKRPKVQKTEICSTLPPAGHTGLGAAPLWASLWREEVGQEAVVWRPDGTSVRGWREATVFLGRVPSTFRIRFHSRRYEGRRGDVAVDQLEFLDCAMPRETLYRLPLCLSFSHTLIQQM